ncbi:hypothetical protein DO97_21335 [Neosynechococcus sphagnicola sy1]|uniref:O-antigen ligase-related domain-containing protein n=1 Tax=Neosynechococcus sphagnicola sy1 TaxID=1497020 RepID=A0A098TM03_9CYAN|nr:O-antigen ligase family protein [Neosynechococcus sphagnicola]KGF73345.1 hypothetical protein DO97_21335 [Neosynechococcus sphagnicola sy1]
MWLPWMATQLFSRQNWLVVGTLVLSISPVVCMTCYAIAALITVGKFPWKHRGREQWAIMLWIAVIMIGLGLRKVQPEIIQPGGVALSDYLPFFPFFFCLSLRPFTVSEIKGFCYAVMLTTPQQLLLAIGENYGHWYGRFHWLGESTALIDGYIGPVEAGLSTSAGFFNPNILAGYCIFSAGLALTLWISSSQPKYALTWNNGLVVLGLFCSVGLLLWSGSQNGLMGFVVMVLLFIWIAGQMKINRILLLGSALGLGLFLLAQSSLRPLLALALPPRLFSLSGSLVSSFEERRPFYACATQLIEQYPLIGVGIGRFSSECYRRVGWHMAHAHNLLLQLGAEVGLPLTFLMVGFMGYVLYQSGSYFCQPTQVRETSIERSLTHLGLGLLAVSGVLLLMQGLDLALLMSYRLNFLFWIGLAIPYSLAIQPPPSAQR